MTSKLSKVVVFPILLTREVNSMFRETQGREAELIRVSSGFAVDCSCSSSSGMVGNVGQGQHCCVGTGDARPGAVVVPFPLSPSHSPARGFLWCAACREHQLRAEQLLTILTLWQHCWWVLLNQW